MEGDNEVERQQWHPNVVRMRMVSLQDASLEQITRDDHARQVERDVAAAILADRAAYNTSHEGDIELAKKHQASLEQQAAERKAAAEKTAGDEAPAGQGGDDRTPNQRAAELFAEMMGWSGLKCQALRTQAIANRGQVKDGWVVNYHDQDTEIGFVATWWGRNHFQAFVEIAGHSDRTAEAADIFAAIFRRAQGPGI